MTKILIDASNIYSGGAVQVGLTFIRESFNYKAYTFFFIVNIKLKNELVRAGVRIDNNFLFVDKSPSVSITTRNKMLTVEKSLEPDLVFTIFGPTFVNFKATHVTGFANGWVSHSSMRDFISVFKKPTVIFSKLLKYLTIAYQIRKADFFILETEYAASKFKRRLMLEDERVFVVDNSFPSSFLDYTFKEAQPKKDLFGILCLSAYYPHKNLESIPYVALELHRLKMGKFKFILTLDEISFKKISSISKALGVSEFIENRGYQCVDDLPYLYEEMSMVYSPSKLETFSAVYLESLHANKVLMLNDKKFARDICGEAAIYVNSQNFKEVAVKISEIMRNEISFDSLSDSAKQVLSLYSSPRKKINKYFEIFSQVLNHETNSPKHR